MCLYLFIRCNVVSCCNVQVTKASEMDVGQASPADKENTEETLDSETSETKAKATPAAKKPGILMKQ